MKAHTVATTRIRDASLRKVFFFRSNHTKHLLINVPHIYDTKISIYKGMKEMTKIYIIYTYLKIDDDIEC